MQTIREFISRLFDKKPTLRKIPGRFKVRDAVLGGGAITYRMGGFFPGAVTRTHPFSIEPCLKDPSAAPMPPGTGAVVKAGANTVVPIDGTFAAGPLYGIVTRPYPTQAVVVNSDGTQVTSSPEVDLLRYGYIGVACNGTPTKDSPVYVWIAASAAPHVQGGFEAASGGASTVAVSNCKWNGPGDVNGFAELIISEASATV